jgi:hypothetical protein
MRELHTMYEWCMVNNIRPNFKLNEDDSVDTDFMLKEIDLAEFKEFLATDNYKEKSTPRKPNKFLELRMYRLVPYNISDIQKGIQFDHAKDDYYNQYFEDIECYYFRTQWFTTIALNGGTSNEGHMVKQGFKETYYIGTMQQHLADLKANDVKVGIFYEPDLNSMLTSINFIVDERVWDKDLYPDFTSSPTPSTDDLSDVQVIKVMNKWSKNNDKQYQNWVDKLGGPKNVFLREFLKNKRLA